jgi:uncharacterized protein YpbB
LVELDQFFSKKLEEVDKVMYLAESILNGVHQFDFSQLTVQRSSDRTKILDEIQETLGPIPPTGKRRKRKASGGKRKKDEPSTYDITLSLLESGMSVEDIAKERGLVVGTIEGHLAKAVEERKISIEKFMSNDDLTTILNAIKELPEGYSSKDLFDRLKGKFRYGQLRAVANHIHILSLYPSSDSIDF